MDLELFPSDRWEAKRTRVKGLLVAINMPGYYSLPVRILSLRAMSDTALDRRYDIRYIEWDSPQYHADRATVEMAEMIETISRLAPEILGLSMNIWNRNACIDLSRQLKINHPDTCIIVGGQEVTNSVVDYLNVVPAFDYLIDGEGELPFMAFLDAFDCQIKRLPDPGIVPGLRYRKNGTTDFTGPGRCLSHLDENQSIVLADLVPVNEKNRLGVLLESSRGCPNRCGFCFEGAKRERIRLASTDRLAEEAAYMAAKGARYFHVMDPILCNSNAERLAQLSSNFKQLRKQYGYLAISAETYADQITDAVAQHLGEFSMLDIGLQSTHPPTLAAIQRKFNRQRFTAGIERIRKYGNMINIYLILGLPHETAASFFEGLFFAMGCRPSQIFINELLLLNGTDLRRRATEFGYAFDSEPPYTVYATNRMSSTELRALQTIAKSVEHRYNLNNCVLSSPTPWRPTVNRFDREYETVVMGGPCKQACMGCRLSSQGETGADRTQLPGFLSQQPNANVELICGDGIPIATIIHTAAQARLAGALRIKLTAPFTLFARPDTVDQLVNAGIHFFRTYFEDSGSLNKPEFDSCMQGFKRIRRKGVQIRGQPIRQPIHPHVEIVMIRGNMNDADQIEKAMALGIDYASLIEIGDWPQNESSQGEASLIDTIDPMIDAELIHRFFVALPAPVMASLFEKTLEQKAVMKALDQLGLAVQPTGRPCFLPGGGINTSI